MNASEILFNTVTGKYHRSDCEMIQHRENYVEAPAATAVEIRCGRCLWVMR